MAQDLPDLKSVSDDLAKVLKQLSQVDDVLKKINKNAGSAMSSVRSTAAGGDRSLTVGSTSMMPWSSKVNVTTAGDGVNGGGASFNGSDVISKYKKAGGGVAGNLLQGALGVVGSVAGAGYAAIPSLNSVVTQASGFYDATLGARAGTSRSTIAQATFSAMGGGLTSQYGAANSAAILSHYGITPGSSFYTQTLRGVGNLAKYMNMPNEQAAAGLAQAYTGSSSSRLLSMGIWTTNPNTGKKATPGQIMSQYYNVVTAGNPRASLEEVNASILGGHLGASIDATFGTDSVMGEYARRYFRERAKGNVLDITSDAQMNRLIGQQAASGNANPQAAQQQINNSQAQLTQAWEQPLLDGFQKAADAITAMNTALANVDPAVKQMLGGMKGFLEGLQQSPTGAAATGAAGGILGGLLTSAGGILGALGASRLAKGAKGLLSKGGTIAKGAKFFGLGSLGALGLDWIQGPLNSLGERMGVTPGGNIDKTGNTALTTAKWAAAGLGVGGPWGAVAGTAIGIGKGLYDNFYGHGTASSQTNVINGGATGATGGVTGMGGATAGSVAAYASQFVGAEYKWGGNDPSGWDCSGFVKYVYARYGVNLPRTAAEQARAGTAVASLAEAVPGDLLFFHFGSGTEYIDHVAIYAGNGEMVEAANQNAGTRRSKVPMSNLVTIRRVLGGENGQANSGIRDFLAAGSMGILAGGSSLAVGNTGVSGSSFNLSALMGSTMSTSSLVFSGAGISAAYNGASGGAASTAGTGTGSGATLGGGGSMEGDALANILRAAGFQGNSLAIAWSIVKAESGGNPRAHNPKPPDNSYGLFQINMLGSMGPDRRKRYGLSSNEELFDPATNARVAWDISNHGTNWKPWSTYLHGTYKQFLSKAPSASGGLLDQTHDQVYNVHEGESVLTAQQTTLLKRAVSEVLSGGGGGHKFEFNIHVQQATREEAINFAKMVKEEFDKKSHILKMGRS